MKKFLFLLFSSFLILSACGNSPQQKAKNLENELDEEYEERGEDFDYSYYYDHIEDLLDQIKDSYASLDDADEQLDERYIDTEDQDSIDWNKNMASDYVTDAANGIDNGIDFFESEMEYEDIPKGFEEFDDKLFEQIHVYQNTLNKYGEGLKPNETTNATKEDVKNEFDKFKEFNPDLEDLKAKAYEN